MRNESQLLPCAFRCTTVPKITETRRRIPESISKARLSHAHELNIHIERTNRFRIAVLYERARGCHRTPHTARSYLYIYIYIPMYILRTGDSLKYGKLWLWSPPRLWTLSVKWKHVPAVSQNLFPSLSCARPPRRCGWPKTFTRYAVVVVGERVAGSPHITSHFSRQCSFVFTVTCAFCVSKGPRDGTLITTQLLVTLWCASGYIHI